MHARLWQAWLVLGAAVLTGTQLLLPGQGAAWVTLQATGIAVTVAVLLRVRPQAALCWWLLVAARLAGLLSTGGWILQGIVPGATELGMATAGQYALYAVAAVRLTRRKRTSSPGETGFEAGAIVVGLAMLAWCLVVEPYLGEPGYRQVDNGLATLYAVFDLAILAATLRGLFRTPHTPARLLSAGGAALLTAHMIYAATGSAGAEPFLPGGYPYLFVQLWGVLLTAAALHPAARMLGTPPIVPERPLIARARLLLISLTAVASPFLPLISSGGTGVTATTVVPAVLVASLCGLLLGRIWLMASHDRERARHLLQAQDELAYRATHDSLTGLANRDMFALSAEESDDIVLLCGIDDFKAVNDAYGHAVGDAVLKEFAVRVRALTAADDLVARLSGDEFGVLAAGGPARAQELASRISRTFAEPVDVGALRIHLTVSIGLADAAGLGDADLALQSAKRAGGDTLAWYDPALRAEQTARVEIAEGLRRALADGSLSMQYQPVVSSGTGETTGVEALLRWRDISPAVFVPVAEQAGLIGALGDFALRTACREAVRWHTGHGIYVTVNVSSHQLRDPGFADSVVRTLADTGLPATALVLEITESVLVDAEDSLAQLRNLRSLGIRIAIDDFGTGYSSLAYLHLLPADLLKIDRTFVARHEDPSSARDIGFTKAILELAASQGLTAVAEGVETAYQAHLLRDLGCPLIQGFYYSRPLDPAAIDAHLAQSSIPAA